MLLGNPLLANRSCADCAKYRYDDQTGRLRKNRDGSPMLRPAGMSTPCHRCPKISPRQEWRFRLSKQNRRTVELYYASRATGGACLGELATDEILIANFAAIDQIVRSWESNTAAERLIPFLQDPKRKIGL